MRQLTIHIPENKFAFFMELANNLGFEVEKNVSPLLTEKQISLLNEERKKIKDDPEHFLDWEEARKSLKTN